MTMVDQNLTKKPSSSQDLDNKPFDWIQLELVPLPHCQNEFETLLVWWNPDQRQIVGEKAELVKSFIHQAMEKGASGPNESVELNDPLSKPTELAAILGQYFWVIPQPVREPGNDLDSSLETAMTEPHSVQ
ncbi:hypothetical protein [Thiomicrorhabdus indica]|uniref:hypothetical protein n=1 Tax=Thiomicrorhabdus indica TaxID=2267253 RepID=UPI00102DAD48|nr:hypothetical protein [Thiomicrorhabdus indica]